MDGWIDGWMDEWILKTLRREMIDVIFISSDQPTVTTFTTGTPGNSVVQGATVNLTCSANGYPSPKYTIRHGVKTLDQESRTGRHVINNIQLNEVGRQKNFRLLYKVRNVTPLCT